MDREAFLKTQSQALLEHGEATKNGSAKEEVDKEKEKDKVEE